jgi:hypothetical protein
MNRFFILFIISLCGFLSFGQSTLRRVASLPTELNEISGIQFIQNNFWAINDGGNPSRLHQIDTFGNIIQSYVIPVSNVDWEDICSDGDSIIYIGDFGNNDNNRINLAIYSVNLNQKKNDTLYPTKLAFSYSDQFEFPPTSSQKQFDCEAFVFINDTFHLFNKNRTSPFDGWVKHYILPLKSQDHIAQISDSFKIGGFLKELFWVTSVALNKQQNALYLLSSDKMFTFNESSPANVFGGTFSTFNFGDISQKEGICIDNVGNIWITDEANNGPAGLYTIDRVIATKQDISIQKLKVSYHHDSGILMITEPNYPGNLSITDIAGSLIFQHGYLQTESITIPTLGWAKGVYIIQFTASEQNYLSKIKIY